MYIIFIQSEKTVLQWASELNSDLAAAQWASELNSDLAAAAAAALQMKGYATAYEAHKTVQEILIFCGQLE
jgi:hypothetical protein